MFKFFLKLKINKEKLKKKSIGGSIIYRLDLGFCLRNLGISKCCYCNSWQLADIIECLVSKDAMKTEMNYNNKILLNYTANTPDRITWSLNIAI